jgi:MAP/microtubule affinity-regulating kinase
MRGSSDRNNTNTIKSKKIEMVGNYKILNTIGRGQFGKVKAGYHELTKERVALKFIVKSNLESETLKLVTREIMIMKLLNHPHIIKLFEIMETDDYLIMVMEHASGGELVDLIIAHGRLQEQVARRFFRQLVSAIDYCHSMHVVPISRYKTREYSLR